MHVPFQSNSGYSKEILTRDPAGISRSPDPKKSKIQSVHTRDVTGSHFYDPDRPIPITTDP